MIPGVGEAMDVQVLAQQNPGEWQWWAAGASLVVSVLTIGFSPNAGAAIRGVDRAAGALDGGLQAGKTLENVVETGTDVARGVDGAVGVVAKPTIRNAHLAGRTHPVTGIPFDAQGFPDFSSVATKTVPITPTGTRAGDFAAANRAANLVETPRGFTWHHHQDGVTMQLVPTDIHRKTGHTGGFSIGGGS